MDTDTAPLTSLRTGGCLCGAIRYEVADAADRILLCHCTNCQRSSGTAASANVLVGTPSFRVTQGQTRVFTHLADSGNRLQRHFCGDCGSPLFSRRENAPQTTVLKVGTLDDPRGSVVARIWTRSTPPWAGVEAQAPAHPTGLPPSGLAP